MTRPKVYILVMILLKQGRAEEKKKLFDFGNGIAKK